MSGITENVWAMQNELRNKEGITGIDAMHHVLMVLLAKSFTIEQCEKLNIPEEYAFENMINLNKTDLYNKFYNPSPPQNCVVRYIRQGDMFGYTKDLPFQIKNESTLEYMYHRINNISTDELMNTYDVVGDIYEHFINREGKTMKDLGQYFTDRGLIKYLVNLCNPQLTDGKVPTVWDPSSGTGGFIIEYIKQLNDSNPDINWSLNKNNLFANDINKNTYSLLKQNMYYSLKEVPGITVKLQDSLVANDEEKYDYILANPPFGIKGLKYKDMNEKIKSLGINGTKGEILFLQLCMCKLNENGKCAIVIPEGVLFNSTKMYKETRKYLLEKFNLKKVIKVGSGEFFKNTGVKTSVLFFEKNGKTENVEFIQVNKMNDSIEEIPLMTVEMHKIIENDYSLNMNLYKEIVLDVNEDFEVVNLSDIIQKFESGKYIDNTSGTMYPYYNSNGITGYLDTYMLDGEYIVQAGSGSGINENTFYTNGRFNHTNFTVAFTTKDNCLTKYLYYYIRINLDIRKDYCNTSTIPNLDKKSFIKSKIVLPPLEVQNRIVEQLDNIYETETESSKKLVDSLKLSIETIMKNTMYRDDLEEYKIKDMYAIKYGDKHTTHEDPENLYPCISGGSKVSKYTNNWNLPENTITIARSGSCGHVSMLPVKVLMGSYGFSLDVVNLNGNNNTYIYHILKAFQKDIEELALGATVKNINRDILGEYKIRIPPIEVQKQTLEKIEPKESLIQELEKNIERAEQEAKDIMQVLFN